ncbi:hypothetical protein [Archaeoglobus sulfaticallidus]|nr:hypothetical protein [Archaeoglobus sulfaticallidus]
MNKRGIVPNPNSLWMKFLVVWYGIYQASHVIVNLLYFLIPDISFPPPPPDDWSPQIVHFFTGMAATDLINAVLTLVFVYGYFKKARWSMWLGTLTLTISMYAAIVFTYGTIASGAWTGNLYGYLWFYIPFVPVVILFVVFSIWGVHGKFLDNNA